MNPYRLKNVFEYLTSNNQLLKKKLKLGTSEIPIPPKRDDVTTIEAINRFNKANPRVDTTSLKPLSVKHSNVNEPNEGAIQSAFDTATRDAQFEGYPAPSYEKFKSRYLKKNMKADGGRIGFKGGADFATVADSKGNVGAKSVSVSPSGSVTTSRTRGPDGFDDRSNSQQNQNHREAMRNYQRPTESKIKKAIDVGSEASFLRNLYKLDPIGLGLNIGGKMLYNKFIGDQSSLPTEEEEFDSYLAGNNIDSEQIRELPYGYTEPTFMADGGRAGYEDGGMLVQPSDDGSRPGYAKEKPLNNTELKIFNNYLKARKNMKLAAPTDENKMKIKSKVRVGDIDNNTIKNMKEKFRYENVNQQLRYDTKLKRWEKTINKNKNYIQKAGETKTQFLKRVESIASKAQTIARKKQDVATSKTRTYIDNWTRDWLDNNLEKYGVRKFDKMTNDLKNDWKKQIKNLDIDKGFVQNLSTKSGLPNVTAIGKNAFNYNDIPFYTSVETTKTPLTQWRNLFFKNKIDSLPEFKKKILDYFNFINTDKRGLYNSPGGQTIKAYKDIVDKDVIYLLSPDANLKATSKYNLFNSFDDNFSEAYNNYTRKVNRSIQWRTSATTIEKALGLKPNFIKNSMDKEKTALAKIFDVKQLPEELRYTLEHAQGISAAAKTGDKTIMQTAVNDLIGTTIKQNKALGFGGFEANRNALVRDITAGVNVDDNLKSLNSLSRNAYKDFGIKGNIYSLKDGKLTTSSISPALTQEERFVQYFKELDKTKEGSAAIKKQAGSLKNLEQKILQNIQSYSKLPQCKVGAADGGRIGFAYSDECVRDGLKEQKIEAQKGNKKAAQELVQVGKVATRAGLLKNLLGPGAILGEAVVEGAIIGNKVLGGKPADIAWAESYLSYLDPRKYSGQLDPLEMSREDMTTRVDFNDPDYPDGKTVDGPNANILRSGFAAQDDITAFNKAVSEKARGEKAGRLDISNEAAANIQDMRRTGRVSAAQDIISSDAFQDASNMAQEYIANQEAQNRFNLGIFGTPQGELSDDRRRYEANKAMLEKFPMYTPEVIDSMYQQANIEKPENFNIDIFNNIMRDQDKMNYFADNFRLEKASGGIASLTDTIPPKSGPTPHGLPYVYNNVKKI